MRQRSGHAQALLRGPGFIIVDEPTAHLDLAAEAAFYKTFASLDGVTRLLISHRLSALTAASTIFLMASGEIAESGKHDELLSLGGQYAQMFRAQSAKEAEKA